MKLSIITVNLNNSNGLKRTISSVLNQTYKNFEYIIIDGGSTDGSVGVIKTYTDIPPGINESRVTDHEPRISYWISSPDSGIYNAMNKGIKLAKGEYCYFLNSGDYLLNMDVLTFVFSSNLQSNVFFGNLYVISTDNKVTKSIGSNPVTFLDVYMGCIKHQATFIKRILFDKFGLYDDELEIIADWDFLIKSIFNHRISIDYIDTDIACYDNNGISNNPLNSKRYSDELQFVTNKTIPSSIKMDYMLFSKYHHVRLIDSRPLFIFLFRVFIKFISFINKLL